MPATGLPQQPLFHNLRLRCLACRTTPIPCYYTAIDRENPLEQPEEQEKEAEESGEAEDKGCEEKDDK